MLSRIDEEGRCLRCRSDNFTIRNMGFEVRICNDCNTLYTQDQYRFRVYVGNDESANLINWKSDYEQNL